MIYSSKRYNLLAVPLFAFLISTTGCSNEPGQSKVGGQPTASPSTSGSAAPNLSTAPKVIPTTPISGSGDVLSSAVTFHDDAGQTNIAELFLVINDPDRGVDGTGGCVIWQQRLTGDIFLLDDIGKGWLGPHKAGSKNVLVNSQCLVSLANSNVGEANGDLQWVTAVGFSKKFKGPKRIYAKAINRQKAESNFALIGSWIVN